MAIKTKTKILGYLLTSARPAALAASLFAALAGTALAHTPGGDQPTFDPTKVGYRPRLFIYNTGTKVINIFNHTEADHRNLDISHDYCLQLKKAAEANMPSTMAEIAQRKQKQDQRVEQSAATNETFQKQVEESFARQRALLVNVRAAAPPGNAEAQVVKTLDQVTLLNAQFADLANTKGLPAEVEAQLTAAGLPADQIEKIKAEAGKSWADGFKQFQQIRDQNPALAGLLDTGFQSGDLEANQAKYFDPSAVPAELRGQFEQQFKDQFEAGRVAAQAKFLQNIGSNEQFASLYQEQAKRIAEEFSKQGFPTGGAGFVPPDFQKFQGEFTKQFGGENFDPTNFDPTQFSKQFQGGSFGDFQPPAGLIEQYKKQYEAQYKGQFPEPPAGFTPSPEQIKQFQGGQLPSSVTPPANFTPPANLPSPSQLPSGYTPPAGYSIPSSPSPR